MKECLQCTAEMEVVGTTKTGMVKYACTFCEYTETVGKPKGKPGRPTKEDKLDDLLIDNNVEDGED